MELYCFSKGKSYSFILFLWILGTLVGSAQQADISVNLSTPNASPLEGYSNNYTLTATNSGPDTASNVDITCPVPNGYTYSAHSTTAGTYDPVTGIWNPGTIINGQTVSLSLTLALRSAGTHDLTAELTALSETDPDSAPGSGASNGVSVDDGLDGDPNPIDDDESVLSISPQRGLGGILPDLTCSNVPDLLNWDTLLASYVTSAPSQTVASDNGMLIDVSFTGDLATMESYDHAVNNGFTGGVLPAENGLRYFQNFSNNSQSVTNIFAFGTPGIGISDVSFNIYDVDMRNYITFSDEVTIIGYLNGVPTLPVLIANGPAVSVNGNTATGIIQSGSTSSDGNLQVAFDGTIDEIHIIQTSGATTTATNPSSQGYTISDMGFCTFPISASSNDFTGEPLNEHFGGTTTGNVYVDDTIRGTVVNGTIVTPSVTNDDGLSGVMVNANGTVTVPAGSAPGSYSVTYQVCETRSPNNCATATVNILVLTDSDADGVVDIDDVDDDNDGILDIDEQNSGIDRNTDGDAVVDRIDPDSDGDGCLDVVEAGFTDPDGDGYLGNSPVSVDANGQVVGQGGYTPPADIDSNSVPDHLEAASIAPIFTNCPADIGPVSSSNTSCGAVVTWTPPTVTDNCGPVTLTTNGYDPGDEFLPGTTTVIYTATDTEGNTITCSFDVTVVDNEDPVLTGPGNITTDADVGICGAVVNYPDFSDTSTWTVTDNCQMSTGTYPIQSDFELGNRDLYRSQCWQIWGAGLNTGGNIDPTGTSVRTSMILTSTAGINDGNTRKVVSPLTFFNGTGEISFDHYLAAQVGNNTRIEVHREDESGTFTSLFSYIYTNTSIQNTSIPVDFTGNYRIWFEFVTDSQTNSNRRGWLDNISIPGIDLSDTGDNPNNYGLCGRLDFVISQTSGFPSGTSFPVGTTTNTFEVRDAYNNVGTYSFDVTVNDTENPTASDPAPLNVQCSSDVPAPDPLVVIDEADNCTANPTVAFVGASSNGAVPELITRTYSVTDTAGNSIQVQHQITVQDAVAPTASDPAPSSYQCASDVPAPDPLVVIDEADNCTANPTVAFVGASSNGAVPELITRTYSVTDTAGNSIQVQHQITVQDTEAPIPDLDPLPNATLECGETLTTTPTATDNCTGTIAGVTTDPLTYNTEGTYSITWTYDDGNGNTAQQVQNVLVNCSVDIEITKTVNTAQAIIGDNVLFTITASNLSSLDATNMGVEEIIPEGFELVSSAATHGTYDAVGAVWDIPILTAGESANLEINATVVDADNTTNIAELIFMDQVDANPSNDRDQVTVAVSGSDCLLVYNEFSPNGDGANEFFFIECIEEYPNNLLQIFNRWGTKVFEMRSYDNSWDGRSAGRATIQKEENLPVGTYYYILELGDGSSAPKTGWLYITR